MRRNHIFRPPVPRFFSRFHTVSKVAFPQHSNTRVMMMPIKIGIIESIPASLNHYNSLLKDVFAKVPEEFLNRTGYLTIDEARVKKGKSHRRPELHVDGVYRNGPGGWGGGGGGWGAGRNNIDELLLEPIDSDDKYQYGAGMFLAASHAGCAAWNQIFEGTPGPNGECKHLLDQCKDESKSILQPNEMYWLNPLCVHTALPMPKNTSRQLFRLSMPSTAPWFSEYTPNPLGIKPEGPVIDNQRSEYMNFRPK